ncbi:MAG: ABC transporter permease subunit [Akkermansia sp.]
MSSLSESLSLLPSPRRVGAVASVTLTQLIRMRLFVVLAIFFVGFLGLQFLPFHAQMGAEFAGVSQLELMKDIGSGCMYLFGLIFAVAATSLLIPRDVEDRILYTILCKPVPRLDYLLGKALGVLSLLFIMALLMDGMICAALYFREASLAAELQQSLSERGYAAEEISLYLQQLHEVAMGWDFQLSLIPMVLSWVVLTSMTLLLSCITSGTLVSMILSLGFFFVGLFQGQFFAALSASTGAVGTSPALQQISQVTAVLLPDFSLFAVGDAAMASTPISGSSLLMLGAIAGAYFIFHLLLASYLFSKQEC